MDNNRVAGLRPDRRLPFLASRPDEPTSSFDPRNPHSTRPRRTRHVWVSADGQQPPVPGLILQWRYNAAAGGWEAWTIYLPGGADDDSPVVIQAWLPADALQPAGV